MTNTSLSQLPAPHAPVSTSSRTDLMLPTTPLRVCGYARVSTDLQREKETIRTQVELIEKFCTSNGHTLVETFSDDGISGTTHLCDRPAGARLLADARAGKFDAIVVYKADRLGRSVLVNETVVHELFGKLGIKFLGVAEQIDLSTPIGAAMFTFQSAIGKLERENTLQRSRDATLRLAREGTWLGGITPYGYRVEGKDRDARLRLSKEVDPATGLSEVDVVRQMFRWSAEDGLSSIAIADRLNALGVPTAYVRDGRLLLQGKDDGVGKRKQRTQGVWRGGRVRNLLIEPTYRGLHVWGRRGSRKRAASDRTGSGQTGTEPTLIERAVPSIVDEKTWHAAQLTLRRNRLSRPDIEKRPYLLRGLMKCAHCGLTYIGTVSGSKRVELATPHELANFEVRDGQLLRPYYACNNRNPQHGASTKKCPSGYVRAKELELLVWREVEGFLHAPDSVIAQLRSQLSERAVNCGAEKELKELLAKQAAADAERATLYRLFRRGGISEGDLNAQLEELQAEEKALTAGVERLEREVKKARDAETLLTGAKELLQTLKVKIEADDSWTSKRRIVEALVAGVEVESVFDPCAPRGKARQTSLCIAYRFEVPDLEDAAPRTAKTPLAPSGLLLHRAHENATLVSDAHEEAREAAKALLRSNPKLPGTEVVATLEKGGLQISPATVSRLRSEFNAEPRTG